MAISFQKSHSNFYHKSRTPPFPQIDGPEQILKPNATTKSPFWGCSPIKFLASLTFHKRSAYAAFEKRPPCPCFTSIKAKAWGSSKKCIFRIKSTPHCAAARLVVCTATRQGNPSPSFPADLSEGRLATQEQMRLTEECHAEPFDRHSPPI
jgi:hypothetical protein